MKPGQRFFIYDNRGVFVNSAFLMSFVFKALLLVLIKSGMEVYVMPNYVLAEITASVSELKKNPMGTIAAGEGSPIAILNRNKPAFYCIPAKAYEALLEKLENLELNALADTRKEQLEIEIKLDDL